MISVSPFVLGDQAKKKKKKETSGGRQSEQPTGLADAQEL